MSPIRYVRTAKLHGSLFDHRDGSGLVSSADTKFWIDHSEPLEALTAIRKVQYWPLGDLHDGHEFLLIVDNKHKRGSGCTSVQI